MVPLPRIALVLALVLLAPPVAQAAGGPVTWSEAGLPLPTSAGGDELLEKLAISVRAVSAGEITVTYAMSLANASEKDVTLTAALPSGYTADIPGVGPVRTGGCDVTERVTVQTGTPPVPVSGGLAVTTLEASSPLGREAGAVSLAVRVPKFATTELVVTCRMPWTTLAIPQSFPKEKGFSVGLEGLAAWGNGVREVQIAMDFEPNLLGPAAVPFPAPFDYTSRGLRWTFTKPGTEPLVVPPRLGLLAYADWGTKPFEGVYFAHFEIAAEDAYPWNHRFFWANPLAAKPDGTLALRRDRVTELVATLVGIEQDVLAHNGKRFADTFVQMRYEQQSWYRQVPGFSEDRIKPVELWNLAYTRCQQRAAKTVLSALEKMHAEEQPASGRRFDMLMQAFKRCDDEFWNPKPRRPEGGGLR